MLEIGENERDKMPLHKRLAIFETVAGQIVQLGRLTASKVNSDEAEVKLEGATEETLQRIRHLINPDLMKSKTSGKKPLDEIIADFKKIIEAEGFQTEVIPEGDYQVMFTFDMNTGKVIGTQKALHSYATDPEDLATNMMQSIKKMLDNVPTRVAERIKAAITAGDHPKAVEELKAALDEGQLGFAPNIELLDAVSSINLTALDEAQKNLARDVLIRTAHQLNRMDIAAAQAELILKERSDLTDTQKSDLEMIVAHAAVKDGHIETAMMIWRRLLKTPEKMAPESRGWALRNISMALDIQNPETLDASRRSADAFLEAGNKDEAGRSLMRLSKALLYESPSNAIEILGQIESLANQEGLHNQEMLSALYHTRANRLSALGDHESALADAKKAVELKRGLIGLEPELISSFYLVEQELRQLGRQEEAEAYAEEAVHLTEKTDDAYFKLANRVAALTSKFDQSEADAILAEAEAAHKHEIISAAQTLTATMAPNLTDTQRLTKLEACLKEQDRKGFPEDAKAPARKALVIHLIRLGQLDRAEIWLNKIMAANPIDRWARDATIDVLWKQEKWGDAAIFLRKHIERGGELPGLAFALGKSLLKAGTLDDAVTVLHKASNLAGDNSELKAVALRLRDEALDMGGKIIVPAEQTPPDASITSAMFEQALLEFCQFIKADKRMTFWNKESDGDYEWISGPEGYAQTLLHTYLKGKFGERINIFEEIKTGAGRIDIYVQLKGGPAVVVELKMCGFRYSAPYAASGEEQVLHYLENKNTSLGYLIVFDARLDRNGEVIMPPRPADKYTVKEIDCDVRPRFGKKASTT